MGDGIEEAVDPHDALVARQNQIAEALPRLKQAMQHRAAQNHTEPPDCTCPTGSPSDPNQFGRVADDRKPPSHVNQTHHDGALSQDGLRNAAR
ncbi:hypothetical protein [uncultured Pelagimonas sp.]|uniref:hypothetical protein n=1 Tax=uncultured Pelagimonas sp. TaxID=1618102 RepID=UPI00261CA6F1|nr:hypothetical protein [uncultured Pelagimonas sp.]